jgi:hypothetical protein
MASKFTEADALRWAYDGQPVWARYVRTAEDLHKGTALKCLVVKACGNHAFIRSINMDKFPLERWTEVQNLYPRDDA